MNYQEQYADRLTTPAKAAKMLESGMVCASDIGLAHSCLFFDAVGDRVDRGELSGIVQHSLLDLGPRAYFSPRTAAGYHGVSWFSGGAARKAAENGTLDIMPAYYRDIPGLFRDYLKPEAFVAVVSSMDRHGYFSTGCDSSITPALLQNAKLIFLEVNSNMPRSLASPQIHIASDGPLGEP